MFLVGSGRAFLYVFCTSYRECFSPLLGAGGSSARLSLPPSPPSPPSLLGADPGAFSLLLCACWQDTGHPVPPQAGAHGHTCLSFFLLSLPGSAAVPPLSFRLLPSLSLSLLSSLSLSLFCMQALRLDNSGCLKEGHSREGHLRMGFSSAVRTWTGVFALQCALDTSILTALAKGIPQGRCRLVREGAVWTGKAPCRRHRALRKCLFAMSWFKM